MRLFLITACLLCVAGCASASGEKTFRITPVVTMADSQKCAANGGNAGLIADLGPDGVPVSGWVAGCILEVK